ncbi:hypothetical protein Tco_0151127 [Tanacetum coccineum]
MRIRTETMIEKIEQVFEISKCAEDDKVKFAYLHVRGSALTSNRKSKRCSKSSGLTDSERNDIRGSNTSNRFHELVPDFPKLMPTESKKIESNQHARWHWSSNQFRVRLLELVKVIKGNGKTTKETPITITITTTITTTTTRTATETTIIPSNKTGDRNLSGHMLQPQLEERFMLEIYQSAIDATYIQLMTLSSKVPKCQKMGHLEKDLDAGPGSGNNFLQNMAAFGVVERTPQDKCPKARNQQNDRARARAYVVVENPLHKSECGHGSMARATKGSRITFIIKADEKKLDDIRIAEISPEYFSRTVGFTS